MPWGIRWLGGLGVLGLVRLRGGVLVVVVVRVRGRVDGAGEMVWCGYLVCNVGEMGGLESDVCNL